MFGFQNISSMEPEVRRRLSIVVAICLIIMLSIALGPRPPIQNTITFDPASIGPDPDAYVRLSEGKISGITPGAEKEIVWADPAKRERTKLAFVYIHGFSATRRESSPLTEKVAQQFGANVFYTRLAGHGSSGDAMAKASMGDWVNDLAEAIAIGELIGERIVLIGVSTGGTLATWGIDNERMMAKVKAMVLISPNYELQGASLGLLNMPWGKYILPAVMGDTRSFEPSNEEHGKWWTTTYPSLAVFPMAALMQSVAGKSVKDTLVPALFILSPNDKVVKPGPTREKYAEWGGNKKLLEVTNSDDPNQHVIAGDILSPSTTDELASQIGDWIRTLDN
ncbi:MAG: alpha/beta fold hydrolase [Nitratireductor sp.]